MDQYAVLGNPVAHSLSPQIHTDFARQTGQQMNYRAQLVEHGQFQAAASEFFAKEGKGVNITVPFKQDAFQFAHKTSERAQLAGAVNTLSVNSEGQITGDNTDGDGLLNDIEQRLSWPVAGKKLLLLGAGGAVRGVLSPLLLRQPAGILIANRTLANARQLADLFQSRYLATPISTTTLGDLPNLKDEFDLIINGTSAGMTGEDILLPNTLITEATKVYDMRYGASCESFLQSVINAGGQASDGLGMLVSQAAVSFSIWRGEFPDISPVIDRLRMQLQS